MPSCWMIVITSVVNMALTSSSTCGSDATDGPLAPALAPNADAASPDTPEAAGFSAIIFAALIEFCRACRFVSVSHFQWCCGSMQRLLFLPAFLPYQPSPNLCHVPSTDLRHTPSPNIRCAPSPDLRCALSIDICRNHLPDLRCALSTVVMIILSNPISRTTRGDTVMVECKTQNYDILSYIFKNSCSDTFPPESG